MTGQESAQHLQVAILDDYQGVALDLADWELVSRHAQIQCFTDNITDQVDLVTRLREFDIIVAMRERTSFPRSLLSNLPRLQLLVSTGMRNAAIDMQAARDHGITVCGTGGVRTSTGELTWGLIIALSRHFATEWGHMREGRWQGTLGNGLAGKTLGIVGLGYIGTQVARYGAAFDMDVVAWSPNITAERARGAGVQAVSFPRLLEVSDFVSMHMRLTEDSVDMIGNEQLGNMKPSAYLVNTARGPLVNEKALVRALLDHTIAGAGLDVYDTEPLPADHPLRKLNNVFLTPHIGYVTRAGYEAMYGDAVDDILAFLDGSPVRVLNQPDPDQPAN
jgi:phosphoglycerate dehydrogenase-like enzyme